MGSFSDHVREDFLNSINVMVIKLYNDKIKVKVKNKDFEEG